MRIEKRMIIATEVQEVLREMDFFITEDGKEFFTIEEAEKHERLLKIKSIPFTMPNGKHINAYFLTSISDVMDLGYREIGHSLFKSDVVFPGWYILEKDYRSDFYSTGSVENIIPLENLREHLEELLNYLPKK